MTQDSSHTLEFLQCLHWQVGGQDTEICTVRSGWTVKGPLIHQIKFLNGVIVQFVSKMFLNYSGYPGLFHHINKQQ